MTHTPGPWGYEATSDGRDWEIAPALEMAANNWLNEIGIVCSGNEADVRLIVAAPDLLDALKGLLALGGPDDVRLAAEAAIAKAEGR